MELDKSFNILRIGMVHLTWKTVPRKKVKAKSYTGIYPYYFSSSDPKMWISLIWFNNHGLIKITAVATAFTSYDALLTIFLIKIMSHRGCIFYFIYLHRWNQSLITSVPHLNMTSAAPLSVVLSLLSQRKEGKRGRSVSHV